MRHHFKAPPVNEVAIGESFVPRTDLLIPQMGVFWDRHLREQYPTVEHGLPIASGPDTVYTDTATNLVLPRVLMVGTDRTSLVQLQPDRLYANWRRMDDKDEYPRFEAVRDRYLAIREQLNAFVKELSGDELTAAGYELTYINAFLPATGWSGFDDLPNFFKPWAGIKESVALQLKNVRLGLELLLPDDCGRLTLQINPATKVGTTDPVMRADLVASADAGVASRMPLSEWAKVAHHAIVETFVQISPADKLEAWGHSVEAEG